jgi:hypothetical protein
VDYLQGAGGDPGSDNFTMPGVNPNQHPGSLPGFNPDPFASLKAIPDNPNLWDIAKGIYGMPNPANPLAIMAKTGINAIEYALSDNDYSNYDDSWADWDTGDLGDWEEF